MGSRMDTHQSFHDVMTRLRAGDNAAASEVFHRYADRLILLTQRRLEPRLRPKMDPEDVLQSVFRSFFTRQGAGQMEDLETWDNLWGMLVVLTLRKCGRRVQYFHSDRRDVNRESPGVPPSDVSAADWDALTAAPTVDEATALAETVEELMTHFEEKHRQILTLALQGCPIPEISAQVGCTERTVYRVLDRVQERLKQMQQGDSHLAN